MQVQSEINQFPDQSFMFLTLPGFNSDKPHTKNSAGLIDL